MGRAWCFVWGRLCGRGLLALLCCCATAVAEDRRSAEPVIIAIDPLPFESAADWEWPDEYDVEARAVSNTAVPFDESATEPLPAPIDSIVYLGDDAPGVNAFGYNAVAGATTWLPGDDDQFGIFSYETFANLRTDEPWGLVTGFGVHFLDGPVSTDMPPRLFDFTLGLQIRRPILPNFGIDIAARVGAFSDFEGSSDKGVRFPSHAVALWGLNPVTDFLLGVEYLDRDDISLLPVVGIVWTPADWLRMEAVFPRPRLAARFMDTKQWIYLGGELGGGTWAIERVGLFDDNVTYRDVRLVLGFEYEGDDLISSSCEIGYVFARKLSYRSGVGDYDPPDGLMLRLTTKY